MSEYLEHITLVEDMKDKINDFALDMYNKGRADERAKVVDEVKQLICPKDIKCHPSCKFAYFKIIGEGKAEYHCEIEQLKEQK